MGITTSSSTLKVIDYLFGHVTYIVNHPHRSLAVLFRTFTSQPTILVMVEGDGLFVDRIDQSTESTDGNDVL